MEVKEYTIYTLNDPATNLIHYVGCTSRPLQYRLNQHTREKGRCPLKHEWMRGLKEQKPSIKPVLVIKSTKTDAHKKEKYFIETFAMIGHPLLNSTGEKGTRPRLNDISCKKISSTLKARHASNPELREQIGSFFRNKPIPEERKERIRAKMKEIAKRRPVLQFNKNGELLARYDSLVDAQNQTGISFKNISSCANRHKGRPTAGGFVWKFQQ